MEDKQINFDPQRIYPPYRQFRPRGSHPRPEHWRSIRQQAIERDGNQCRLCSARDGEFLGDWGAVCLEVHHRTYERFGNELLDDVTTLCQQCHRQHTDAVMAARDRARVLTPRGVDPTAPEPMPAAAERSLPLPITVTTVIDSLPSSQRFS